MSDGSGDAPANYLEELFGDEEDELDERDREFSDDEEMSARATLSPPPSPSPPSPSPPSPSLSSPSPPPYSPLSSPERHVRDRSRSPVSDQRLSDQIPSMGVVLGIFDEDMQELRIEGDDPDDVVPLVDFMSPDAHQLYVLRNQAERDHRARSTGGRAQVSSSRSGRGGRRQREGAGGRRLRGPARTWAVGHPLEEIWSTDADVPEEMREMMRNVVDGRRRMRTQAQPKVGEAEEEEFQDAVDVGISPIFEWCPMDTFRGEEEPFLPQQTGSVEAHQTAYGAFRSFWDGSIIQHIVTETNRYAATIVSQSFQSDWYATNSDEILCLFAFWMMLGIIRMPTITSCFSNNSLLKTEVFRALFTRNRYKHLVRALHFANVTDISSVTSDRLALLRPIIDHINVKFQTSYVLSKDIAIDESLTLWKGRLNIRQYIRSKAAKFGIKTFELCESATGYLWSFIVYTGRHNVPELSQDSNDSKSTAVVKKLISPLLHKGYRLFMDNWYNSPMLARFLKRNGTDCVGTLRATNQDVPPLVSKAPLNQGQLIARHAGDVCVLAWQDKKRVTMISTCHGAATGLATVSSRPPSRPLPFKPQVVLDYNKSMGGVDLKDQMLEPYLLERKRCRKWYMKLFKRLLNCSILNARTLLKSSTGRPKDHLEFRLELVDQIMRLHLTNCPKPRQRAQTVPLKPFARVVNHTHWPVKIPPSAARSTTNRLGRARCVVCLKRKIRSDTSLKCHECNVPLCAENCFRIYHSTEFNTL